MTVFEFLQSINLVMYKGVPHHVIEKYQHHLLNSGLSALPLSYARLLEQVNGVQTDILSLFGIGSPHTFVRDIAEVNSVGGIRQNEKIFLGDNFQEYLIYDWTVKNYVVISKENPESYLAFAFLEEAMPYFLRDFLLLKTPEDSNQKRISALKKTIKSRQKK